MRFLVAGGTSEGREVAAWLAAGGHDVVVSVREAGAARRLTGLPVRVVTGTKDGPAFVRLLAALDPAAVVDAGHPFAVLLHRQLREAAQAAGVPYLRFGRPPTPWPEDPAVVAVPDHEAAAAILPELGRVAFLTVGVRALPVYARLGEAAGGPVRLVVRLLPRPESLRAALRLGIRPEDVVAFEGPGGEALNRELLAHFGADVLVTKDSGERGGVDAKLAAARALGVRAVVVARPAETDVLTTLEELGRRLAEIGAVPDGRNGAPPSRRE